MKRSVWFFAVLALAMLSACRTVTEYVPVETVRTEWRDRLTERTDSVWMRDSVYVAELGDTVRVERWRWRERYSYVYDTCYVERTDSVAVPYPVEKRLTRWERAKMEAGGWAMGAVLIAVCVAVGWIVRRRMLNA